MTSTTNRIARRKALTAVAAMPVAVALGAVLTPAVTKAAPKSTSSESVRVHVASSSPCSPICMNLSSPKAQSPLSIQTLPRKMVTLCW
jgi:hypothetical protein